MTQTESAPTLPDPIRVALSFTAHRLRAYCDYLEEASAISDASDLLRLNAAFVDRMRADYLGEAMSMFRTTQLMAPLASAPTARRSAGG